MALTNNMLFFDLNYGEFASVTGTNLQTETAQFASDNRSADLVDFSTCTGEFIYDFGAGGYFNLDTWAITNHNLVDFYVQFYTGTTWVTYGDTYTANSATTTYYNSGSITSYIEDAKIVITKTVGSEPAYFGEFIVTKKKFQVKRNPSSYDPVIQSGGIVKSMWDDRIKYNEKSDVFKTVIDYSFLEGDANTITNTDLQNMTELSRKKTSFLFWPNANNENPNMFTWRKQDIFKCKMTNDTGYEFSANNLDYMIKGRYIVEETQ